MQLVADRFAVEDDGRARDLATGAAVTLMRGSAGGISEQMRWAARCDGWQRLQHRAIAPLVDYGMVGGSSRFEAWLCGSPWPGAPDAARSALDVAVRVLRASGLSAGAAAPRSMRVGPDGAVLWLPDAEAGYPCDEKDEAGGASLEASFDEMALGDRALAAIERPAVHALAEMFEPMNGSRPHVAAVWGPRGSGKRIVVRELSRMARLRGFVPVAARLMLSRYAELWSGRSVFVIDDRTEGEPWPALLHAALRAGQPHALLFVGEEEPRSVDGVRLERIPAAALVASLRPAALTSRLEAAARRAAERSGGLPGVFAHLLSGGRRTSRDRPAAARRFRLARVAEQPASYGSESGSDIGREGGEGSGGADSSFAPSPQASTWPAPGELAALRRRLDGAVGQIAAGQHAPGIRQLRQAIGGLARRDAWPDAARGGIALAAALLGRGRPREAQKAIEDARRCASRSARGSLLLELATLCGEAWIDLARLDEAESVLGTAVAASRAAQDPARAADASLALARCLFWRGRHADADTALTGSAVDLPAATRARHARLSARIAIGLRDSGRAMTLAAEELQRSRASGDARAIGAAACTAGFVHLAVGDLDAVERDVTESIAASRAAHDPLRIVRARLLLAEAERRRGRSAAAAAHLQRLKRIMPTLPATLRARWELLKALAGGAGSASDIVARQIAATGLGALALYVPAERDRSHDPAAGDPIVEDIVAILRVCQTAEDESVVLKDVCARVRERVHAAAVAFVVKAGGRPESVACDGARLETDVAERAIAAGVTVAPHRHDDRIDAAAPVHYGGLPIGALCARWTIGSTDDLSRAAVVLTTSAAAAAPILSAALARRRQAIAVGVGEFLGVTPAMGELRRSVERAAAAPFAVLIEGESGSGKELVARAIHRGGPRRDRPFCTLNCAALPDDLVEAELFGHARGSFTGAVADRAGVFEEAHGGTLFLDEIGELSLRAQAKILRVIQEGELRRVGENVSRRVDVRVVAATNRDLRQEVAAGRFRLDLLYRLDVVRISVPALRDRREDIAVLADHFWRESTARVGSRATLSTAALAALARYDWPGNVRELQNVLAALTVRSPKRGVVPPEALPASFTDVRRDDDWRLDEARRAFETRFIRAALARSGGHRGRAAAELGVTRQGLTKLITRLGIGAE